MEKSCKKRIVVKLGTGVLTSGVGCLELGKMSAVCAQIADAKKRYERVTAASDEFLEKLGYRREGTGVYRIIKPSEERIALFCHQGFSMIWFPVLLGIVPHIFWSSFDINHAGVSVFEFKNYESGFTSPRCISLSDNSHLLRDGLPYKHQNYLPL